MSQCEKSNNKKYAMRNSPPFPANKCKEMIKEGNDGKEYISKKDKNGIYKWTLHVEKKIVYKNNPDAYFKQFDNYKEPIHDMSFFMSKIKELYTKLKKIGVLFYFLKWSRDSTYAGHHSIIGEKAENYIETHPKEGTNGFLYMSEYLVYSSSLQDGIIYLSHELNKNIIPEFNKIIQEVFPNRTLGYIKNSEAIKILYNETKKIKKTKDFIMMELSYKFKNKKDRLTDSEAIKIAKSIKRSIGSKIIYDLRNVYALNDRLSIFYMIYDDKIEDFAKKIKMNKNDKLPDIKFTYIGANDKKEYSKKWEF
jgi:hypothetical protein